MRRLSVFLKPALFCLVILAATAGFAVSAEHDDSALFVEAFNAFQKKDYLLTIERLGQLQQAFPDSPLRDVVLLLQARAGLRAGDNQLAAKSVNQFADEFSGNSLRTTIEEELLALGARLQKGEQLQPNVQLKTAAQKVRNERLALERAAAQKAEQERLAREKAERDRIAREKAESERRERERLAAEKAAKEAIKVAIAFAEASTLVPAGDSGRIGVDITNRGKTREEFLLKLEGAPEFGAQIGAATRPEERLERVALGAGDVFRGVISLRMPVDRVDGYRGSIALKVESAKFSDVQQIRSALVVSSAPLVRVVAKPVRPKAMAGDTLRYRVTVLNVGSLPVKDLTIRVQLPTQLDFLGAPDVPFRQEPNGSLVFRADKIASGGMEEFGLDVKVRENARSGQELRAQIEVVNGLLQRKDIFSGAAVTVQGK